ncbi:unnamed protein product [Rhizoctonia solani]|uniref:Uncharacterized protein n=1 Tax=Rhizoctonia solani TaxID=456999 RepID=A0A8H3A8P8_9AGAM|nr:unnamed protein product [Rhizoctonia solani]
MPQVADLVPGPALSKTNAHRRLEATTIGYDRQLPSVFGYTKHPYSGYDDNRPPAKPLVELEMIQLSARLRQKPSWWTKCRDETILSKWREEALDQAKLMQQSHIDYVLKELDGYANLRDEKSGAEVSCYDGIWQSDILIPIVLKEQLVEGITKLENIPEPKKNWHPRSNRQVLDLVHPSLYPIVYGRTLSYPKDSDDRSPTSLQLRLKPLEDSLRLLWSPEDFCVSKHFQWLPTDFEISEDGISARSLSYINNLHPQEYGLYKSIEELVAAYIPLFERVLTDCIRENHASPERTYSSGSYDWNPYSAPPISTDYSDAQKYSEAYVKWREGCIMGVPHVQKGGYLTGSLEKRLTKHKLGGRTIQVIVKLTSIHLTPGKPEYAGGSWRVEGMVNEAIAASGIYCYDEDNITESRLAFRTVVYPPNYFEDDDKGCVQTWGMPSRSPAIYDCRPTTTAGMAYICYRCQPSPEGSTEIIDHVHSMAGDTMTRAEADAYRLELIDERMAFEAKNNEASVMMLWYPLYGFENGSIQDEGEGGDDGDDEED